MHFGNVQVTKSSREGLLKLKKFVKFKFKLINFESIYMQFSAIEFNLFLGFRLQQNERSIFLN